MKKFASLALLVAFLLPVSAFAAETLDTINSVYNFWWGRNARSDEISFHQTHGTSIQRLEDWVREVRDNLNVTGKYQTSELEGYTVSVPSNQGGGMYLIQNGQRHRVYDYPTAIAFGLQFEDRISLPTDTPHLNYILSAYPEGAPLNFGNGQYKEYVEDYWYNGRTEVTEESDFVNTEIFSDNSVCLLTSEPLTGHCTSWDSPGIRSQLNSLFDWSFYDIIDMNL
ncbi:MAG: hypothetical protein ABIE68_00595 [bacterium]